MSWDRKIVYLNAAFLAVLGLGFALTAAPLPAFPAGRPWEPLATERLLGALIGGTGLALLLLRRLDQPADFRRLTLALLILDLYAGALVSAFWLESGRGPRQGLWWGFGLLGLAHLALGLGFCATIVWKKGTRFRDVFRVAFLLQSILAVCAGYGVLVQVDGIPGEPGDAIRILGLGTAGLGLALAVLGNPGPGEERRRLLLGLGAGNALGAVITLIQLNVWGFGSRPGWGLVGAQVLLAAGSALASLRPDRLPSRPGPRALASRLTWSHLAAGALAAGLGLGFSSIALPSWAAPILGALLAAVLGAFATAEFQREFLSLARASVPAGQEPGEARETWLRQVSEAAAQEERNRLARDLHDSIKQQIFSVNVSAAAAQARWESDPEGARAALADVRRCAQEAMVEMRALLQQLRPRALAGTGLIEALREQCEALGYRSGSEVSVELGEPIPDDRLPPGTQETLFRIAQEALGNVARHARARHVHVRLGRTGETARLQVEDDGQGFNPAEATSGMGLRNLRERAESLRGNLEIDSAPGAGSRVSVSVPFTPAIARRPDFVRETRWSGVATVLWFGLILIHRISYDIPRDLLDWKIDWINHLCLYAFVVAWNQAYLWYKLRHSPGASATGVARFRFVTHRFGVMVLIGAFWVLQPGLRIGGTWTVACKAVLSLCLLLAGWETVQAYRWSRPRSWGWNWPAGWKRSGSVLAVLILTVCLLSVAVSGFLIWLLPQLDLRWLAFLASWAAVAAFFLWRRPLAEGAPS